MNCFEEFKKIIQSRVKKDIEITMESNLKELGLDSLDLLEIVLDVEGALGVHFEDDQLIEFKTIKDVLTAVEGMKK